MTAQATVDQLAAAIRTARSRAHLTQAELGEFVDADRFAIAAIEAGKTTTQLRRLLDVLDAVGLELKVQARTQSLAVNDATDGGRDELAAPRDDQS